MALTLSRPAPADLNAAAVHVEVGLRGAKASGPLLGLGLHVSSVPVLARAERGMLRLRTEKTSHIARAVAVAAGVRHALESPERVTVWYLEPGTLDWAELKPGRAGVLSSVRIRQLAQLDHALFELPGRVRHAGVAAALEVLRADPGLDVHALSKRVGLSPSRLRHAFREHLGVNTSRYRWWLRLRLAALGLAASRSVTDAAHDAGFSDGAHFSRTFRGSFGFPPSRLIGTARWTVRPG
jgi:AraC-like DNA-binding protein